MTEELRLMFDLGLIAGIFISMFFLLIAIVALAIQAKIDSKKREEDSDENVI